MPNHALEFKPPIVSISFKIFKGWFGLQCLIWLKTVPQLEAKTPPKYVYHISHGKNHHPIEISVIFGLFSNMSFGG
jgi:hypothetical protein